LTQQHFQAVLHQPHDVPQGMQQAEMRRWYARMLMERNAAGDRNKARAAHGSYRGLPPHRPKHQDMAQALPGEV
jgi:hypothetical protein